MLIFVLELLHMDPKSAEAQVFYPLNNGSSNISPSAAPSPSGNDWYETLLIIIKKKKEKRN